MAFFGGLLVTVGSGLLLIDHVAGGWRAARSIPPGWIVVSSLTLSPGNLLYEWAADARPFQLAPWNNTPIDKHTGVACKQTPMTTPTQHHDSLTIDLIGDGSCSRPAALQPVLRGIIHHGGHPSSAAGDDSIQAYTGKLTLFVKQDDKWAIEDIMEIGTAYRGEPRLLPLAAFTDFLPDCGCELVEDYQAATEAGEPEFSNPVERSYKLEFQLIPR